VGYRALIDKILGFLQETCPAGFGREKHALGGLVGSG